MPAEPHFEPPDPREVDPRVVRRAFSRAAATYDSAAVLQREIGNRMTQRLDYVKLAPQAVLDAGCGTGEAVGELAARYPAARIIALDAAVPMLSIATARVTSGRSLFRRLLRSMAARTRGPEPSFVCGDIVALPLR